MSVIHPGSCKCAGCIGPAVLRDKSLAVELAEMEARDPKLKTAGERVEAYGRAIATALTTDAEPACGPCADARDLVLTSGFPAEPCKFCGGPTGKRVSR